MEDKRAQGHQALLCVSPSQGPDLPPCLLIPASSSLHPASAFQTPFPSRSCSSPGSSLALGTPLLPPRMCHLLVSPSVIYAGRLLPAAEMWSPAAKYTAIHLLFVIVSPTHLALQTKNCVSHLPSLCGGEASLEITCGLK